MKKRFVGYDAHGTDGTDLTRMSAVYEVLDDEGFISVIHVPAKDAQDSAKVDIAITDSVKLFESAESVDTTLSSEK